MGAGLSQPKTSTTQTKNLEGCGVPTHKNGNATCPCGAALTGTKRQKFCSDACRINAYRALQKAAKAARRLYRYQKRNSARAFGVLAYGGPVNNSVPRVGQLELKPFIAEVRCGCA